jgi:hypothetical protein
MFLHRHAGDGRRNLGGQVVHGGAEAAVDDYQVGLAGHRGQLAMQ